MSAALARKWAVGDIPEAVGWSREGQRDRGKCRAAKPAARHTCTHRTSAAIRMGRQATCATGILTPPQAFKIHARKFTHWVAAGRTVQNSCLALRGESQSNCLEPCWNPEHGFWRAQTKFTHKKKQKQSKAHTRAHTRNINFLCYFLSFPNALTSIKCAF